MDNCNKYFKRMMLKLYDFEPVFTLHVRKHDGDVIKVLFLTSEYFKEGNICRRLYPSVNQDTLDIELERLYPDWKSKIWENGDGLIEK